MSSISRSDSGLAGACEVLTAAGSRGRELARAVLPRRSTPIPNILEETMNTWREDHDAAHRHPAFFHSDRSRRDDDRESRRDRGSAGEGLDDGKPGRARRRPPRKGPREGADDRGGSRREPRGARRRDETGYDRRSGHDRLRDYPRRHDWRDPEDAPDDDELL